MGISLRDFLAAGSPPAAAPSRPATAAEFFADENRATAAATAPPPGERDTDLAPRSPRADYIDSLFQAPPVAWDRPAPFPEGAPAPLHPDIQALLAPGEVAWDRSPVPTSPSGPSIADALAGRLHDLTELTPDQLRPTSLLGRTAFAAGSMAAHPISTVTGVISAPFLAAWHLGQFARQERDYAMAAEEGQSVIAPRAITPRDAAFAAGQLLVPGVVSKALPYLETVFGATMARTAAAAVERGETPAAALLKGYAMHVATRGTAGAAIGAVYAPDDPAVGALLGAGIGGAAAALKMPWVQVPQREVPPSAAAIGEVGDRARPPATRVTARPVEAPPAATEAPFTVEDERPGVELPVERRAATPPEAPAPADLETFLQAGPIAEGPPPETAQMFRDRMARDDILAAEERGERPTPVSPKPRAPSPATLERVNAAEEVAAERVAPTPPARPSGGIRFPVTVSALQEHAAEQGLSIDDAAAHLTAAKYTVAPEVIAAAKAAPEETERPAVAVDQPEPEPPPTEAQFLSVQVPRHPNDIREINKSVRDYFAANPDAIIPGRDEEEQPWRAPPAENQVTEEGRYVGGKRKRGTIALPPRTTATPIDVRNAGVAAHVDAQVRLHEMLRVAHPGQEDVTFRASRAIAKVLDDPNASLPDELRAKGLTVTPEIAEQAELLQRLDRGVTMASRAAGIHPWETVKKARKILLDRGMAFDDIQSLSDNDLVEQAFPMAPDEADVAPGTPRALHSGQGEPVPTAKSGAAGPPSHLKVPEESASPIEEEAPDGADLRRGVPAEPAGEPPDRVPAPAEGGTPAVARGRGGRPRAPGVSGRAGRTGTGAPVAKRVPGPGAGPVRPGESSSGTGAGGRDRAGPGGDAERAPRARDLTFTPELERHAGAGVAAKVKANLTALETLHAVEAAGRPPTLAEQTALAKYTGWGQAPGAFDPAHKQYQARLRELLTPEEYDAARRSTVNAHYTSPAVVRAVHHALNHLGFTGGRILEPSAGAGYFLGLTPPAHRAGYRWTAVELDSVTGRLARLLYPEQDVRVQGFQDLQLPDGFFDAAVGNVPFGDFRVPDRRYDKLKLSIHNYFFRKALDLVRPGGLVAFITSRYTMDATDPSVRRELAKHADLVAAIRLPSNAFKAQANTDVVTDLLLLKRRLEGVPASDVAWAESVPFEPLDGKARVNEYFAAHPQMMLGTPAMSSTMHATEAFNLEAIPGEDLGEQLDVAIGKLRPTYTALPPDAPGTRQPDSMPVLMAPDEMKEGSLAVVAGAIRERQDGVLVDAKVSAAHVPRVTALIGLRDLAKAALEAQFQDRPDAEIERTRKALNRAYDAFHRAYGPINKEVRVETKGKTKAGEPIVSVRRPNLAGFEADPEAPLLRALELVDDETGATNKGDLLTQRVFAPRQLRTQVDTPAEALPLVLAETGAVDLDEIARLANVAPEDARQALRGAIFEDPETGAWQMADRYLSGDVKAKLERAEAEAARDPARWKENVKALQAAQPEDLPPSKISAQLGAPWLPPEDIAAFITHLLGPGPVRVFYNPVTRFHIDAGWQVKSGFAATNEFGTNNKNAIELLEHALNLSSPTVYDPPDEDGKRAKNAAKTLAAQEKLQAIKDRFARWVWEDPARAQRLAGLYNERFNRYREPRPDGSHLQLPGAAAYVKGRPFSLRPHQKNAIWRILNYGNTLLAHVVGAGKTYTMVAAGMEAKRLGIARKPLYAVPNHMLEQFSREFKQLYPNANLLVATPADFEKAKRQAFVSRAALTNYDAVVMTHRSFEAVPMSDDFQARFIKDMLQQLEATITQAKGQGSPRTLVKQIEKAKLRLEERVSRMMAEEKKDDLIDFEHMGVDMLFVDEADEFKNLMFTTAMEGVTAPASQRAWDLYMKSLYLEQINKGRGLVFATGTPIANQVAEMYTMQRYLQMPTLQAQGLAAFDDWAGSFGETVTGMELKPDGNGYRAKTRFAKYRNMGELAQLFRSFADVQTAEMLNLPRPKLRTGKPIVVAAPTSGPLKAYIRELVRRGEALQGYRTLPDGSTERITPPDPAEDNWLKLTSDGRHAGLDMRLVRADALDLPDAKVNLAAEHIARTWRETAKLKGAQLVFSDLSVPGAPDKQSPRGGLTGFNIYDDLKAKLIAAGIPKGEIRFMQDVTTPEQKAKLFADVRAGRVRVLLGSTAKMGMGTNVQDRLVALHHLDAPWRPRDIEQRNGRILRQGNLLVKSADRPDAPLDDVAIYTYVTEGSFDAYMWQGLERKAGFITQAMTATAETREIEDVDEMVMDMATVKAIASGNPKVKEKAEVDAQVARLERLAGAHTDEQFRVQKELTTLPRQVDALSAQVQKAKSDVERIQPTAGEKFTVSIGGTTVTKRPEAGAMLQAAVQKMAATVAGLKPGEQTERSLGRFAGFDLALVGHKRILTGDTDLWFRLKGDGEHFRELGDNDSPASLVAQLEAMPAGISKSLELDQRRLEADQQRLADLKGKGTQPFPKAEELTRLRERQQALAIDLQAAATAPLPPEDGGSAGPGGVELLSVADPFTAAIRLFQQAQALRRQRLGLPPKPPATFQAPQLRAVAKAIQVIFNPATVSPVAGVAGRGIRAYRGALDREIAQARELVEQVRGALDKLDPHSAPGADDYVGPRWQWLMRAEQGQRQPTPELQAAADVARKIQDAARDAIVALGPGHLTTAIDDYMGRIFAEDPALTTGAVRGKRPFEGTKGFKKHRSFEKWEDAVAHNLSKGRRPISDNPLDMVLLKVHEMRRYLMAHRIKEEWKATGIAKFKKVSRKMPAGWAHIDSTAFTVFAPRGAQGEQRIRGHWVVPEDAARLLNNYLSKGLRGNPIYDAYAWTGNQLNMLQLGASAFHAGFVAFDATVQLAAVGIDQVRSGIGAGDAKRVAAGAGKLAFAATSAALGPVTPIALPLPAAVATYLKGRAMWRTYLADAATGELEDAVRMLVAGGGRHKMADLGDSVRHATSIQRFRRALTDRRYLPAALHAPFAAVEATMWPLLDHVVPRMKMGAAFYAMHAALQKLPAGATPDQVREAAARAVDNIDARLGQMIYDNRFWHRVTRELMLAGIRAPGWNVGSFDVTVGAASQGLKNLAQLGQGKRPKDWSKVDYLVALAGIMALWGAIYTYLHTGERPGEMGGKKRDRAFLLKDLYFPRNGEFDAAGNPRRMTPASYVKDLYGLGTHPLETAAHKLHPLAGLLTEYFLTNKDFFDHLIRNPDDDVNAQAKQIVKHAWEQDVRPFSVRNLEEATRRGENPETKVQGFFGTSVARRDLERTPAQNKMAEFASRHHEDLTPEQVAQLEQRQEMRRALTTQRADGTATPGRLRPEDRQALRQAVRERSMSPAQATAMAEALVQGPLIGPFQRLNLDEQLVVWDLADADEKATWARSLYQHAMNTGHQNRLPPDVAPLAKLRLDRPRDR